VREVGENFGIKDWNKYEHLNPGQQRMMIGNRIRGAVKKQEREREAARLKMALETATEQDREAFERIPDPYEVLSIVTKVIGDRMAVAALEKAAAKERKDEAKRQLAEQAPELAEQAPESKRAKKGKKAA
jgi:hypothetical protein